MVGLADNLFCDSCFCFCYSFVLGHRCRTVGLLLLRTYLHLLVLHVIHVGCASRCHRPSSSCGSRRTDPVQNSSSPRASLALAALSCPLRTPGTKSSTSVYPSSRRPSCISGRLSRVPPVRENLVEVAQIVRLGWPQGLRFEVDRGCECDRCESLPASAPLLIHQVLR